MTRYLTVDEVRDLHRWGIQAFGGSEGVISANMLDSAVAAPQAGFGGVEAYPSVFEKAAVLAYSLIHNHAFIDGNKRVAFSAMSVFLKLNGQHLKCDQEEGAEFFLALAAGDRDRDALTQWIIDHCTAVEDDDDA
jgi:death on curing protein